MVDPSPDGERFDWVSKRNCALRPGQLAALLAVPAGASLAIAASFASLGAWWILVFAIVETLALAAAFLVYARHAGAYERLSLTPDGLRVEFHSGSATTHAELDPRLVRIEFACARITGFDGDALVTVRGAGQAFRLGRFVPAPQRAALAARIRRALQQSTASRPATRSVPSWQALRETIASPDGPDGPQRGRSESTQSRSSTEDDGRVQWPRHAS